MERLRHIYMIKTTGLARIVLPSDKKLCRARRHVGSPRRALLGDDGPFPDSGLNGICGRASRGRPQVRVMQAAAHEVIPFVRYYNDGPLVREHELLLLLLSPTMTVLVVRDKRNRFHGKPSLCQHSLATKKAAQNGNVREETVKL